MNRRRPSKWHLAFVATVGIVGMVAWYALASNSAADVRQEKTSDVTPSQSNNNSSAVRVTTIKPKPGGLAHTTNQPGSVIAYESAKLFAKVSGYLKNQSVDIGDHVKQGQLLAELDAPELIQDVKVSEAALTQAKAQVEQANARIEAEQAAYDAAKSAIVESEARVTETTAYREFREKQYKRIRDLFEKRSIEERLVDEKHDEFQAAAGAEATAKAAVVTAKATAAAAQARIAQAMADKADAEAKVGLAQAELAKSQVLADYLQIRSPYNGVITDRNFFRGDFIVAANQTSSPQPLLGVARTDKVRVVVDVPDRDVPYLNKEDTAEIKIDALPGAVFKGKISRFANSEDSETRLMRTEIDLPNPDDKLYPGMYGKVVIHLVDAKGAVRVPSSCLEDHTGDGHASLYVVRGGKAHLQKVRVGQDNGEQAEILSGLTEADNVVIGQSDNLTDGIPVQDISPQANVSSSRTEASGRVAENE